MRKLDTSFITSTARMPVKQGTLEHLQLSYQESIGALAQSIINRDYDPQHVYILTGCVNWGDSVNYNISAGWVFYQGEVFQVDAAQFMVSGGMVAVATIVETYFAADRADPVSFTDGSTHNVHLIRKVRIAPGFAASGIADYVQFRRSRRGRVPKGSVLPYYPPNGSLNGLFDSTGKGIAGDLLGWAICNGQNGTPNLSGRFLVGYDRSDPNYDQPGKTGGEKMVTLTVEQLPPHDHELPPVYNEDGTGTNLASGNTWDMQGGENKTLKTGGGQPHENRPPYFTMVYIMEID